MSNLSGKENKDNGFLFPDDIWIWYDLRCGGRSAGRIDPLNLRHKAKTYGDHKSRRSDEEI